MQSLVAALRKFVTVDKNSYYDELIQKITNDQEFAEAARTLSKKVNRSSSDFDEQYLRSLSEEELLALIRGLTWLDGKIKGFTFRSVGPVPWLINELQQRNYKYYETIVDWVFKNRTCAYLPFGSMFGADAKSLKEYQILIQENKLKIKKIELDAEFRRLEKIKLYYTKATADLRNAIRRNNQLAYSTLVRKGAELYLMESDGKTLAEKIQPNINVEILTTKNTSNSVWKNRGLANIIVRDSEGHTLTIKLNPTEEERKRIDCASITARYDHGMGWSLLYRFVEDKEDKEIEDICDWVVANNRSILLPQRLSTALQVAATSPLKNGVSINLRVIVTPIVKGNSLIEKNQCKEIMRDIIDLAQSHGVQSRSILITQFGFMLSYRDQHLYGIVEAIKERQVSSFLNLREIIFEVDNAYEERFRNQLKKQLID